MTQNVMVHFEIGNTFTMQNIMMFSLHIESYETVSITMQKYLWFVENDGAFGIYKKMIPFAYKNDKIFHMYSSEAFGIQKMTIRLAYKSGNPFGMQKVIIILVYRKVRYLWHVDIEVKTIFTRAVESRHVHIYIAHADVGLTTRGR